MEGSHMRCSHAPQRFESVSSLLCLEYKALSGQWVFVLAKSPKMRALRVEEYDSTSGTDFHSSFPFPSVHKILAIYSQASIPSRLGLNLISVVSAEVYFISLFFPLDKQFSIQAMDTHKQSPRAGPSQATYLSIIIPAILVFIVAPALIIGIKKFLKTRMKHIRQRRATGDPGINPKTFSQDTLVSPFSMSSLEIGQATAKKSIEWKGQKVDEQIATPQWPLTSPNWPLRPEPAANSHV